MKKICSLILMLALLFICLASCTADKQKETDDSSTSGEDNVLANSTFQHINADFTEQNGVFTAPEKEGVVFNKPNYSVAYSDDEKLLDDFVAELTVTLPSKNANAGIFFNAKENTDKKIHSGFAFMISQNAVTLQRLTISENGEYKTIDYGKKSIEPLELNKEAKLRVEQVNNFVRVYYLDDVSETLVPWPEIEVLGIIEPIKPSEAGIGIIDNGKGASFKELQVLTADKAFDSGLEGGENGYTNPVFDIEHRADPQIIEWEGKYYCYSTYGSYGFNVLESDDMVNWTDKGQCLKGAWSTSEGRFWAPEVFRHNDKFYMVFSNADLLGFAVSDSPLGPFTAQKNCLIRNAIDGHVFFDDDGRIYLYFVAWDGVYGIYGCELKSDLSGIVAGSKKLLLYPKESWERAGEPITEGPAMLKHNGVYYLTYSGSHYTNSAYAVGYATSSSPLEGFTKYAGGPILSKTASVHGPGHHSFIWSKDKSELYIVYHAHKTLDSFTGRNICIDRIRFAPTASGIDRLEVYGPTRTPQKLPNS